MISEFYGCMASHACGATSDQFAEVSIGGLVLRPGDRIVLTGAMRRQRSDPTAEALALGLQVIRSVSRRPESLPPRTRIRYPAKQRTQGP